MSPQEQQQRQALVAEALSWERTPFAHGQWLKGVAADCSTFIAGAFEFIGLFKATVPHLSSDWFLHTTKEEYLNELAKHAVEYDSRSRTPQPGDIVIVKDVAIGAKVFSHGAIVVDWPIVVHCFPPCVMRSNAKTFSAFVGRNLKFFDPFAKADANA